MITVEGRLTVRPREPLERSGRWMEKPIIGEVQKLGWSGGVQRDATQGRKLEKPWKGWSFTNFGRRVFYTQHQSPYFRGWVLNEGSTEKFSRPKLPLSIAALGGCQIFWHSAHW